MTHAHPGRREAVAAALLWVIRAVAAPPTVARKGPPEGTFSDSHFRLTNYVHRPTRRASIR